MNEGMRLVVSIMPQGSARLRRDELARRGFLFQVQIAGRGTASSAMMSILGTENREKDILVSLGTRSSAERLAKAMSKDPDRATKVHGITAIMKITALSNLTHYMCEHHADSAGTEKGYRMEKSEFEYSLVLAAVDQGFAEDAMAAARLAGAAGGTILRGRLADTETIQHTFGIDLQEEKEVLTIITSSNHRDSILEALNTEFGPRSKACGIICSVPLERVFKG